MGGACGTHMVFIGEGVLMERDHLEHLGVDCHSAA